MSVSLNATLAATRPRFNQSRMSTSSFTTPLTHLSTRALSHPASTHTRKPTITYQTRRRHACRSLNEENGNDELENDEQGNPELKLLIDLIVEYPATRGTLAVLFGYLAHINPLQTLHWSQDDVLLGVLCALPVVFWDCLIMVPNWDPPRVEKPMRLQVPRSVAERLGDVIIQEATEGEGLASSSGAPRLIQVHEEDGLEMVSNAPIVVKEREDAENDPMVLVERMIKVRERQSGWRDALRRAQVDRAMNNAGQLLSPASEAFLLLLVHFSEEMLYRGFGLAFAVKWTTDRLYEAIGDDVVSLGASQLPIPTLGATVASLSLVTVAIYLLLSRDLKSLKVIEQLSEDDENAVKLLSMKDAILEQQRWNVGITAVSEVVQWGSATVAFLVTNNLLAPLAGALVADGICSVLQRVKLEKIQDALLADSRERLAQARSVAREEGREHAENQGEE